MKTIKQFCEQSTINPTLIRAVIRQLGGFNSFKESAPDIAKHGISGGFSGFIYYTETVAFTKRTKNLILELLQEYADSVGESLLDSLASFNCLRGETMESIADGLYNPRSENKTQIHNVLAWYAAEEVARSFVDLSE
jgi:F0F1-type ATP synthase gamma subunit